MIFSFEDVDRIPTCIASAIRRAYRVSHLRQLKVKLVTFLAFKVSVARRAMYPLPIAVLVNLVAKFACAVAGMVLQCIISFVTLCAVIGSG